MSKDATNSSSGTSTQLMVLLWCFWLLGSWAVVRWQELPMRLERWMLLASLIGLMVAWPAVRLSQRRLPPGWLSVRGGPAGMRKRRQWQLMDLAVEWVCLVLVFQAVVWPLSFVAQWPLAQALWVNGLMVAWSAAAAALVGWGCVFGGGLGRGLAMALCLVLLAGEQAVAALLTLVSPAWNGAWGVSPLPTLWALSAPTGRASLEPASWYVLGMAGAAAVGWTLLALAARFVPAGGQPAANATEDSAPLRSDGPVDRS